MLTLEPLRADHADALLAFEQENRAYFARTVPDRGDAYFTAEGFAERLRALLAEQDAGVCRFHVVLDEEGNLVGRVNLLDLADGCAELGYRVGERAAGRGVATTAVAQVCRLAATGYGLTSLTAVTTLDNRASMTVLARNGFTHVEDTTVGGRPGRRFLRRNLVSAPPAPPANTGHPE
ncbi:ribosomal-protein-alanine N-acetyltransferase [Streptomyces africanus]|uniref:Ribosomal-protein-alanine N-acetyltransferase n=1 Tax=Streptomyces africanus TaxID=231024 RepID=A0ABU0QR02_9ACTN|nr:GNAT family N-acetyltransferase [Streptomyces africanus]MDQ0748994.1 ribosomal-protein-alanine N-acetyltransferase [Streptomyces africanus]